MKNFLISFLFLSYFYTLAQDKKFDTWLLGFRGTDNFFVNKIKFIPNAQAFVINADQTSSVLCCANFSTTRINDSVLLTSYLGRISIYNEQGNNYGHLDTSYFNILSNGIVGSVGESILLPDSEKEGLFHLFLTSEFSTDQFGKIVNSSLKYLPIRISNDTLYAVSKLKHLRKEPPVVTKLAATHHGNNEYYWILSHEWLTDRFIAYLLTSKGVVDSVKTSIGYVYSNKIPYPSEFNNYIDFFQRTMGKLNLGQMKFSTEGSMVAVALSQERIIEIFKFDKFTGKLSCPISLNLNSKFSYMQKLEDYWIYGLEISPNKRFIYFTLIPSPYSTKFLVNNLPSYLCQLDLWANDILDSVQIIGEGLNFFALQLAPDGKIYLSIYGSKYLGAIEKPNNPSPLCNFQEKGLFLGEHTHDFTLNNVPSSALPLEDSKSIFDEPQLEMPNAFSPNGDGINDTFIPTRVENVIRARIKIYNKWGKEIFASSQIEKGWDASNFPADIYYYFIEYTGKICNETTTKTLKGWVQVIK